MSLREHIAVQRRVTAGFEATINRLPPDSRRRPSLQLSRDRAVQRLQLLEARLPKSGPAEASVLRARRIDMLKTLPDRVEIYDDAGQLLGAVTPDDAEQLVIALRAVGKAEQGRHPHYKGGHTREPGIAVWWRRDDE